MAKDHLLVLYGLINSVVNEKKEESIVAIVYNLEKAYDKLWLDDTTADLIETIGDESSNDKLVLLHESNKETNVSVKTPFGPT